MSNQLSFSAIIPAAGYSERMGTEKAMLQLRNGKTFVENLLINYITFGADPVVIIVNKAFDHTRINLNTILCVENDHVEYGRSYSVKLGIQNIPAGHACFIQNIDNPFVDTGLLGELLSALNDDSYVIPVHCDRGGHPVLLGKNIVSSLIIDDQFADFRDVLKNFTRIEIPCEDPRVLLNINTHEDYLKFMEGI